MTLHQITLSTCDDRQLQFDCEAGVDIVTAAERAGIGLPAICRGGSCGACLGRHRAGAYTLGEIGAGVLSPQAVAAGDLLLCKTYPQTDMSIAAPYAYSQIRCGRQQARSAVVHSVARVADRTMRLQLRWQDAAGGVEFEPGQCMELEIPGTGIRRAYSLANTPNWLGEMEFLIRLLPAGRFSQYLREQAAAGDVLHVYGPSGGFALDQGSPRPALLVAGGTGLAPFLSILRRLAEWGEDRPLHLLFGVNTRDELFYQDELQQLAQQIPGFGMTACVWQPAADWPGFRGTPADALRDYLQSRPGHYDVYLCGPPPLVAAATAAAQAGGVPAQRIFAERFA